MRSSTHSQYVYLYSISHVWMHCMYRAHLYRIITLTILQIISSFISSLRLYSQLLSSQQSVASSHWLVPYFTMSSLTPCMCRYTWRDCYITVILIFILVTGSVFFWELFYYHLKSGMIKQVHTYTHAYYTCTIHIHTCHQCVIML